MKLTVVVELSKVSGKRTHEAEVVEALEELLIQDSVWVQDPDNEEETEYSVTSVSQVI